MDKFITAASEAIWWPNLLLMQVNFALLFAKRLQTPRTVLPASFLHPLVEWSANTVITAPKPFPPRKRSMGAHITFDIAHTFTPKFICMIKLLGLEMPETILGIRNFQYLTI